MPTTMRPLINPTIHLGGTHPDEILLEIGPLEPKALQRFRIPVHAPTWSNSGF